MKTNNSLFGLSDDLRKMLVLATEIAESTGRPVASSREVVLAAEQEVKIDFTRDTRRVIGLVDAIEPDFYPRPNALMSGVSGSVFECIIRSLILKERDAKVAPSNDKYVPVILLSRSELLQSIFGSTRGSFVSSTLNQHQKMGAIADFASLSDGTNGIVLFDVHSGLPNSSPDELPYWRNAVEVVIEKREGFRPTIGEISAKYGHMQDFVGFKIDSIDQRISVVIERGSSLHDEVLRDYVVLSTRVIGPPPLRCP